MITETPRTAQVIQHAATGAIAAVYRVVDSPYVQEELQNIKRVQVWTSIPGGDGTAMGWDYWLLKDCVLLPNAPIPVGSTVRLVDIHGRSHLASVIAAGVQEVAVVLEDGLMLWVALSHVAAVIWPAAVTSSSIQIA